MVPTHKSFRSKQSSTVAATVAQASTETPSTGDIGASVAEGTLASDIELYGYKERRYSVSETQPATPTDSDPAGWSIAFPAVDGIKWMIECSRLPNGTLAAAWSTPVSSRTPFTVTLYKRSSITPTAPTDVFDAAWSFVPPDGAETLWGADFSVEFLEGSGTPYDLTPSDDLAPYDELSPSEVYAL